MPPRKAKAETWPSRKACGLRRIGLRRCGAGPARGSRYRLKSHWAWPGGWDKGTYISCVRQFSQVLDRRVSAVEPVPHPAAAQRSASPCGAASYLAVTFQDGVNHPGEGLKLRLSGWFLPSVWRYRVSILRSVPVQTEHPGGFPNAHPLHHAGPANPRVHLHQTSIAPSERLILSLTKGRGRYDFPPP